MTKETLARYVGSHSKTSGWWSGNKTKETLARYAGSHSKTSGWWSGNENKVFSYLHVGFVHLAKVHATPV